MSDLPNIIDAADDSGPDGRGWIRMHRKIVNSAVFACEKLLKVWIWCLLKATHRTQWVTMRTGRGTTQVEVGPGSFVYGREVAAHELDMPESSVRNRMQRLQELGNLTIQPDNHFSIVTIVNWGTYQERGEPSGQANGQPMANQRTTKGHIQEHKTHKEVPDKSAQPTIEGFAGWWEVYPRKVAKLAAQKSYPAAAARLQSEQGLAPEAAVAALHSATALYAAAVKGTDPKFVPYPATWLNAGRYLDDPATWSTSNGSQQSTASPARVREPGRYDPAKLHVINNATEGTPRA